MSARDRILRDFALFSLGTGGLGSWLGPNTEDAVFERLVQIAQSPLSRAQFNQLLVLGQEAPVSDGFFDYYFLSAMHPCYNVTKLPRFRESYTGQTAIVDLNHLYWGLYRIYVDSLLFFGSVRSGFRVLRRLDSADLHEFFRQRHFNTPALVQRGPALPLHPIPRDNRYLISEMACKSFGEAPATKSDLRDALFAAYADHKVRDGGAVTIKELLSGTRVTSSFAATQPQLIFSADEALNSAVTSEAELESHFNGMADQFLAARQSA